MVITIVGHVATVSLGVKINGYAAICARLGARWTCRNRHQGKGPPERAHAGLGSTKPRYIVYPIHPVTRRLLWCCAARRARGDSSALPGLDGRSSDSSAVASAAARGVSAAAGMGGGSSLGYAVGVPSRYQLAWLSTGRFSATKEPRVVPDGLRMLILRKAEEGRRASASADMGAPLSAESA
jgi:hypothetical protein